MVSAIRIDAANNLIFLADATVEKLLIFNRELEIEASFDVPSPIADIRFLNNAYEKGRRELLLTHIGNISPSDARDGSIIRGWYDSESNSGSFNTTIFDDVRRLVEKLISDLDGYEDLLINNGFAYDIQDLDSQQQIFNNLVETGGAEIYRRFRSVKATTQDLPE